MHFDPSISFGTILQSIIVILAAARIIGKISAIETKVDAMWANFIRVKE